MQIYDIKKIKEGCTCNSENGGRGSTIICGLRQDQARVYTGVSSCVQSPTGVTNTGFRPKRLYATDVLRRRNSSGIIIE